MRKSTLLSMIALLALAFSAKAQTGVQNYVSASGYVIFNAPFYNTGTDGYAFDFENDYIEGRLVNWTTIDADGDSYNWSVSPLGEGYGHNGSDGAVFSYSYSNYSGALSPNNYLVSPQLAITANNHYVSFYACALDEAYPADHFGLAVSTTGISASDFTMLQEWTMTSKQGGWHEYSVDLNSYVGQNIHIAIRHFNSTNNFCLVVDDVFVGPQEKDPLTSCSIALDGNVVATNVTGTQYLLDTDGFANNSSHNTTVTATYQSGATLTKSTDWTFRSSDNFQGSPSGLHANSDGNSVNLSWTLPMMTVPYTVDELLYDFADSTMSDLTLIDNNHDGLNFVVYPFGGYGSGNCLKSVSWSGAAVNPDNFVVLPRVTASANTVFSFMLRDADMPGIAPDPEHFGVAVSTAGNTNAADFTMVQEWNSTGTYTEYSVNLSAYAGQQIYVAIRHFNTTGETYYIYVDDIKITGVEAEITRPAKGALVYANDELIAALNHGETSFTHMVNRYESEYCIRIIQEGSKENGDYYALAEPQCATAEIDCIAPSNLSAEFDGDKVVVSWERNYFTSFEEDPVFTFIDADGDGATFGVYAAGGMNPDGSVNTEDNPALVSFSYINGYGALTPDNYAFMPKMKILAGSKIEFYATGYDPNYPVERFGVAIADGNGAITNIASFQTSYPYSKYSVDLSNYAGQEIFVGFRHNTADAAYALCIDNVTVKNVLWVGTESVTERYIIYRSTDGVNYEAIGHANGNAVSYNDNEIISVNYYYKVTAINSVSGGHTCESSYALTPDNHDYVHVVTDNVKENLGEISVYPNPTNGIVNIEVEGLKDVVVMNALGQKIYETVENQIDLSKFGKGLLMLRIETDNGISTQRILVL